MTWRAGRAPGRPADPIMTAGKPAEIKELKWWSRSAEPTALAGVPLGLIRHLVEHGLERPAILKAVGLTERLLADPDGRVGTTPVWRLWRLAIDRIADEELGIHIAGGMRIRTAGLAGYAMLYSTTIRQALHRLTRYSHIISETLGYRLEQHGDVSRLTLEPEPRLDALRHPIDLRLGAVVSIVRELSGSAIRPVRVQLPYPRPARTTGLVEHFQAPLSFDAPKAMLELRRQDADLAVSTADARLAGYLEQLAEETLSALSRSGSLTDRIMRQLWPTLSDGVPTLKGIASTLGMSSRTLQRRLRQEEATFAAIVDRLRRDMAAKLLSDPDLAVYEVGYLLGYADTAAFHRAFRRWTSRSPREFRRHSAQRG
jgi:AraC-like DNA-binding protein